MAAGNREAPQRQQCTAIHSLPRHSWARSPGCTAEVRGRVSTGMRAASAGSAAGRKGNWRRVFRLEPPREPARRTPHPGQARSGRPADPRKLRPLRPRTFLRDSGSASSESRLRPRLRSRAPIGGASARGVSDESWNAAWAVRGSAAAGERDVASCVLWTGCQAGAGPLAEEVRVPSGLGRAEQVGFLPAACTLPAPPSPGGRRAGRGGRAASAGLELGLSGSRGAQKALIAGWRGGSRGGDCRGSGESGVRTGKGAPGSKQGIQGSATCEPSRDQRRPWAGRISARPLSRDGLESPGLTQPSGPHSLFPALEVWRSGLGQLPQPRGRRGGWPWSSPASHLGTAWPLKWLSW